MYRRNNPTAAEVQVQQRLAQGRVVPPNAKPEDVPRPDPVAGKTSPSQTKPESKTVSGRRAKPEGPPKTRARNGKGRVKKPSK